MTCTHCGSSSHISDKCPTLNLVNYLFDRDYKAEELPDIVTIIEFDDLIAKTEDELHAEVVNIQKLNRKTET